MVVVQCQGYNGSQCWDVTLSVQAILASNFEDEYGSMLKKANNFIKRSQVLYIDWKLLQKKPRVWNINYDKRDSI